MTVKGLKINSLNMSDDVPGMVLLNTTSFSAVASQSVNDVFSATYDAYLIYLRITTHSAADKNIAMRFRVSGADDSSSNYFERYVGYTDFNATDNFRNSSISSLLTIMQMDSAYTDMYAAKIEVIDPFATLRTKTLSHVDGVTAGAAQVTNIGGGLFNATTSFTGFSFVASTGTISGTISVYGYNKQEMTMAKSKEEQILIGNDNTVIELIGADKDAFIAQREADNAERSLLETEYKAKQDARESAIRQLAQTANLTEEQITLLIQGI